MSFVSSFVSLLSNFFRLSFEEGRKAHGPEQRYRSERVGFGVKLLAAGKNPRPPISTDEAETPVIMKTAFLKIQAPPAPVYFRNSADGVYFALKSTDAQCDHQIVHMADYVQALQYKTR